MPDCSHSLSLVWNWQQWSLKGKETRCWRDGKEEKWGVKIRRMSWYLGKLGSANQPKLCYVNKIQILNFETHAGKSLQSTRHWWRTSQSCCMQQPLLKSKPQSSLNIFICSWLKLHWGLINLFAFQQDIWNFATLSLFNIYLQKCKNYETVFCLKVPRCHGIVWFNTKLLGVTRDIFCKDFPI